MEKNANLTRKPGKAHIVSMYPDQHRKNPQEVSTSKSEEWLPEEDGEVGNIEDEELIEAGEEQEGANDDELPEGDEVYVIEHNKYQGI